MSHLIEYLISVSPQKKDQRTCVLYSSWLDTDLGPMLAISDEKSLYLLECRDRRGVEQKIERLRVKLNAAITPGMTDPIKSLARELRAYFSGGLKSFTTPFHLVGTPFQRQAWESLITIPYGQTRAYATQAASLKKPSAYRAVANANGANHLAIIVPCHRVINSNGDLGGYGGGISRKRWLIEHEKKHAE